MSQEHHLTTNLQHALEHLDQRLRWHATDDQRAVCKRPSIGDLFSGL